MCQVIRRQRDPQDSEADTHIIGTSPRRNLPSRPICKQSNADAPKPPAYPFITNQSQRAIVRQKTCDPPACWRIPARLVFRFSGPLHREAISIRHRRAFASVRGYLRTGRPTRKSKKHRCRKIFARCGKHRKIWWLAQETPQRTRRCGNFLAAAAWFPEGQAVARRTGRDFGTRRRASNPMARAV